MSEFIEDEAVDIDLKKDEEDQQEGEKDEESSFIDDNSFFDDHIASNYRLVKVFLILKSLVTLRL